VTPLDNRRLIVSAFARFRIADPRKFRESVQSLSRGKDRLGELLNSRVRQVLGEVDSDAILSDQRAALMQRIKSQASPQAEELGVEIVDVRIRRADLPQQNLQATYDRMAAEREQEAADERARGQEAARSRRAQGQRLATETLSEARKQSEIIKGEADATRTRIFAEAFSQDSEFFEFYRSMTAYEQALQGDNSTMVLSPDSDFFKYLKSDTLQ
ncbi:MAG: protease modulator HflC, partial [Pseudomonadota bacterium]